MKRSRLRVQRDELIECDKFSSRHRSFDAIGVVLKAAEPRWVLNRRAIAITLWIVAAFCAAALAFEPTAAFAHPGHPRQPHDFAEAAPGITTAATTVDHASSLKSDREFVLIESFGQPATTAASVDAACPDPSPCGGICCAGGGCCASACVVTPEPSLPAPNRAIGRLDLPPPLTIAGVSPASLLDPPISMV